MTHAETSAPAHWVGAWYAAPGRMVPAQLSGRTLRQIVPLHAGGDQLRLRLSNRYGDGPVTLTAISVGQAGPGALVLPGASPVRYGGQAAVTLAAGEEAVSDPVTRPVEAFSNLAVTFFLAAGESLTGHFNANQLSYISGRGDVSALPAEAAFLAYPLMTAAWWLIAGVDVRPAAPLNAVVAFGSSTTDGSGSTPGANRRWPDVLARRLRAAGGPRFMSVLNAGLAGNQLTASEFPLSQGAGLPPLLFGEAGRRRLAWDVLAQAGATDLIIQIGSNDLRAGVSGAALIEALQQTAQQARPTYRRVFGATILPGGYPEAQVAQRRLVNTWLREASRPWFDAVFDFATPVCSPEDEAKLHPALDSGDGIHPNDEGYRLIAEAIDINQLSGSPGWTA